MPWPWNLGATLRRPRTIWSRLENQRDSNAASASCIRSPRDFFEGDEEEMVFLVCRPKKRAGDIIGGVARDDVQAWSAVEEPFWVSALASSPLEMRCQLQADQATICPGGEFWSSEETISALMTAILGVERCSRIIFSNAFLSSSAKAI